MPTGFCQDNLLVCLSVSLCLCLSLCVSAKMFSICPHNLLKGGIWDAEHDGNVRIPPKCPVRPLQAFFGAKITMLPNTMKIESWVPQAMYNPSPPTFGRIDAKRGSSVEITKITDFTKRHENRCVGAPGHVQSKTTHIRSHRRVAREFSSNN